MSKIMRHLTAIARCGTEYRNQYLSAIDLPGRHARYLLEIADRPGLSQEAIARRLLVDKSNVARQCAILEESGLILRRPSPEDKRVQQLFLTEKAAALMPQITEAWDSWETLLTQDMTEEEKKLTAELLMKMKVKARQWMEAH